MTAITSNQLRHMAESAAIAEQRYARRCYVESLAYLEDSLLFPSNPAADRWRAECLSYQRQAALGAEAARIWVRQALGVANPESD